MANLKFVPTHDGFDVCYNNKKGETIAWINPYGILYPKTEMPAINIQEQEEILNQCKKAQT